MNNCPSRPFSRFRTFKICAKIKVNVSVDLNGSENITSASTRNVDAGQKSCEKSATFSPSSIPSLAEGAARRPVTTCR